MAFQKMSVEILGKIQSMINESLSKIEPKNLQNAIRKLSTRDSKAYALQIQDQFAPKSNELNFEKHLVGVSAYGNNGEFRSFIFSDGSRWEFPTTSYTSYFKDTFIQPAN